MSSQRRQTITEDARTFVALNPETGLGHSVSMTMHEYEPSDYQLTLVASALRYARTRPDLYRFA